MTAQQSIAQTIKDARESAGLSLRALGKAIGTSHQTIASYEEGYTPVPVETLAKIAATLELTEFNVNGYRFLITQQSAEAAPGPLVEQFKLDFDKEYVYPNATIKITPTRMTITFEASAPQLRPAA